jgi:uncharacterized membrane protein
LGTGITLLFLFHDSKREREKCLTAGQKPYKLFNSNNMEEITMSAALKKLIITAAIAAIYVVLTIVFAPISYGPIQLRISEGLTVLPFITPLAIPGLTLGCLIANLLGGYGIYDVIFGSGATLIAAYLTYKMPTRILAPLPPVIVNGIVIGFLLNFLTGAPLLLTIITVATGELVACYAIGYPLLPVFQRIFQKYLR